MQLVYKICTPLHGSWSDKIPMSPKRIVNVGLRYLPKCTEFFIQILENKNLFQTLG